MGDPHADPVAFAAAMGLPEPWSYQEPLLRSDAANVIVAGGRRSGKSQTSQIKAIHVAATNRDCDVYVSHPNIDNATYWVNTELAALLRYSRLRDSVEVGARRVTFKATGSRIEAIPATPGQMRGRGRRVLLWILEEAGFHEHGVIRDVRWTLMDHYGAGAQLWMVGSPWGGPDHPFRQAYERGLHHD